MRQIRALVVKDLRLNGRAVLAFLLGMPLFVRAAVWLQPPERFADDRSPIGLATIIMASTVAGYGVTLASWLVEPERARDTFGWLRTLPVSDRHIVASKFVLLAACYVVALVGWWTLLWGLRPSFSVAQLISIWGLWFLVGSLSLLSQFALSGRLARAAPAAVVFVLILLSYPLQRAPAQVARIVVWWGDCRAHAAAWCVLAVAEGLVVWLSYWRFHTQDSQQWAE